MTATNAESFDMKLPVLNSHYSGPVKISSPPPHLSLQQPIHSDNNSASRVGRKSNLIDPPIPAYTHPSSPGAIKSQPRTLARSPRNAGSQLLRYPLARDHNPGHIPVARLPESLPSENGHSLRSYETLLPYEAKERPTCNRRTASDEREPETLALLFFKFGFFCPPFWVFGALMLITPLRSPNPFCMQSSSRLPLHAELSAWCNENIHTEEDKLNFLAKMQEVEMKWAKRCLFALAILVCLCVVVGGIVLAVLKVT